MFEWLEQEISEIRTPKFHLVDGPADSQLREAILQSSLPLPSSYKEFALKFGNAKLYRTSREGYRIRVFAGPREATLDDGTRIYHLAAHDGASVYVKPVKDFVEIPVFEFEDNSEEKVANNFEAWLEESCSYARNKYPGKKWAGILRGPEPFTAEEKEIIEARQRIHWRMLGIDSEGNHIFEVTNTGHRSLSVLSIGIHSKDRQLNGCVRLDVSNVAPGMTKIIPRDCYKELKPPSELEAFSLPDPQPEDRDYYWELGEKAQA